MNTVTRLLLLALLVGGYQWPVIKERSSSMHLLGVESTLGAGLERVDELIGVRSRSLRAQVEAGKIALQAHLLQALTPDVDRDSTANATSTPVLDTGPPVVAKGAEDAHPPQVAPSAAYAATSTTVVPASEPHKETTTASAAALKTLPASGMPQLTDETPTTLLLVGDSVMGEIAYGLKRWSAKNKAWQVVDAHKVSSGLSNQAYYDWPAVFTELVEQHKPRLVAMMVGANDPQDIIVNKKRLRFGSDEWAAAYASRVDAILDTAAKHDIHVYWVLPPIMREPVMERHIATIRQVIQPELAARRAQVTVIDEWNHFVDKAGHYAETALAANGKPRGLRAEDGVHLSTFGAQLYVDALLKAAVPAPAVQAALDQPAAPPPRVD